MSRERDDDLTPDEQAALAGLRDRRPTPAELEDRVVVALRERGLIRRVAAARQALVAAGLMAALAAAFGAGTLVPRGEPAQVATNGKPGAAERYLLLVHSPVSEWSEPDDRALVAEYGAWASAERTRGRVEGGEKLESSGYLIDGEGAEPRRIAVPAPDAATTLGGYFILRADSYEAATAIAAACPHVRRGGMVELRRIE